MLIALFSVILPFAKLWLLFQVSSSHYLDNDFDSEALDTMNKNRGANTQLSLNKYLRLMHDYGRWAMLDVLVVAVLIVTVKLGAIASVDVHWGLYLFAASVFLTMFLTHQAVSYSSNCIAKL